MNILLVWDRMGDYHRARTEALKRNLISDTIFTADLGATDDIYRWNSSKESKNHFVLSKKKSTNRDLLRRFRALRALTLDLKVGKVVLPGYGKPEYVLCYLL